MIWFIKGLNHLKNFDTTPMIPKQIKEINRLEVWWIFVKLRVLVCGKPKETNLCSFAACTSCWCFSTGIIEESKHGFCMFLSSKFCATYCKRFWTNTGCTMDRLVHLKKKSPCLAWENIALLIGHSCTNHSQQNKRNNSVTEPPGGSLGQDVAKSKNLARSPCVFFFIQKFQVQGYKGKHDHG